MDQDRFEARKLQRINGLQRQELPNRPLFEGHFVANTAEFHEFSAWAGLQEEVPIAIEARHNDIKTVRFGKNNHAVWALHFDSRTVSNNLNRRPIQLEICR